MDSLSVDDFEYDIIIRTIKQKSLMATLEEHLLSVCMKPLKQLIIPL